MPRLWDDGRRFGLIYIDGSHLFETVFVDAYYSARMLTDDGVLVLDDCSTPPIREVVRFLQTNCPGLEEIDLQAFRDQPSLRYSVAKHFGRVQMRAFRRVGPIDRPWDAAFFKF